MKASSTSLRLLICSTVVHVVAVFDTYISKPTLTSAAAISARTNAEQVRYYIPYTRIHRCYLSSPSAKPRQ